jgi:hypothetical protein
MPFYSIPLAILALLAATLALLMFTPIVVLVDSCSREVVKVRWSFLLWYVRFPGAETCQELSVAGISVPLPRRKREAPSRKEEKSGPDRPETQKLRRKGSRAGKTSKAGRFIWNSLLDGDIRLALGRRFRRLPVDLWDAVEVRLFHCEVSLPDPAVNGMLWGALAAVDPASRTGLRANFMANFTGKNEVRTEVRIYPRRVVKAVFFFFLQLPYRRLLKQWRAS